MMRPQGGFSVAGIILLLAVFLLWRISYAGTRELVPDESVYWAWSRHLAGGYLDHPPMIAWMIHYSCKIFSPTQDGVRTATEFAVRCPAVLCGVGSLIVVLLIAAIMGFPRRLYGWLLAIWLTSPLLAAMATLMTPDSPSIFFSIAAVAFVVWIAQRSTLRENGMPPPKPSPGVPGEGERSLARDPFRPLLWLGFGVCCGLGFLSKYPTILVPAAVFLALITSRQGRQHLMRPWIYLSAIPAVAIFWPVIAWNRAHQWASFRYQLNHGLDTDRPTLLRGLGEFIGGQALIWTPVLFVVAIIVLVYFWKKALTRRGQTTTGEGNCSTGLTLAQRILLMNATLPLVFFGYAATRAHGEINWPAFAYFPLSLLTVQWLSQGMKFDTAEPAAKDDAIFDPKTGSKIELKKQDRPPKPPLSWQAKLVQTGCIVAAIGLLIVQAPEILYKITPVAMRSKLPSKLNETFQWKEFAEQVSKDASGAVVVCNRHQYAGELSFYMPGQPDVWAVSAGSRPTAWDYFDHPLDLKCLPRIAFVGAHDAAFTRQLGIPDSIETLSDATVVLPDGRLRTARIAILFNINNLILDPDIFSLIPNFRIGIAP